MTLDLGHALKLVGNDMDVEVVSPFPPPWPPWRRGWACLLESFRMLTSTSGPNWASSLVRIEVSMLVGGFEVEVA